MLTDEAREFIRQAHVAGSSRRYEFTVDGQVLNVRQLTDVLRARFPALAKNSAGTIDQDINRFLNTEGWRIKGVAKGAPAAEELSRDQTPELPENE